MKNLTLALITILSVLSASLNAQTIEELKTKIVNLEKENAELKAFKEEVTNEAENFIEISNEKIINSSEAAVIHTSYISDLVQMFEPYFTRETVKLSNSYSDKLRPLDIKYYELFDKYYTSMDSLKELIAKAKEPKK